MCGQSADGGCEAKGTGVTGIQLHGSVEADNGTKGGGGGERGVERDVQRMGDYGYEGSAVYGDTVSAVGGDEDVEEKSQGVGGNHGSRKRSLWERGRGGGSVVDDAAGCLENKDDAGARPTSRDPFAAADTQGFGTTAFVRRYRTKNCVDLRRGSNFLGQLPMGL